MATNNKTPRIPSEYTPITMWGYFGYQILFSIPVLGWIFVIIFALTAANRNLRNFARSQFCLWIIWLVVILVSSFSGLLTMLLQNMVR